MAGRGAGARPGGDGTPEIGDFAPAELGCALTLSAGSAAWLIADALDLRHRLPYTWAAAQTGQGPVYQARQIAKATRHLTPGAAALSCLPTAARPARPRPAISDPSATTIDYEPTAAGSRANPNPAPGSGDHPTPGSSSSTPPAPTRFISARA